MLERFKAKLHPNSRLINLFIIKHRWTKLFPLLLILLAIPITVALVNIQTQTQSTAQSFSKPDIIVLMLDDMGAIDSRILERLPNIRSLWLEEGLKFENAYSETPLCCPGRATFLSGQNTRNHGVTYNKASLLNPNKTIAVSLRDNGYYTIMAGKYLNNAQTLSDKIPAGWDKVAMLHDWTGNSSSKWWVQGRYLTKGYKDRYTIDRSLTWLKNAPRDKSIFLWTNPHAPHKAKDPAKPWVPDIEKKYLNDSRCNNIEPWKPPNYDWKTKPQGFPLEDICKSLLTVDEMVGLLRQEITRQGRTPIWILTADNGMSWGSDGYPMKNVPQSTKLPLYITGPGIPTGTTNILISNIDLGPTLADLGGTNMSWADGISFAPLLRGESFLGRAWMLEEHPLGGNDRAGGTTGPWWGVRTPQWSYLSWPKRGGNFLYNLVDDPWRLENIANGNAQKISELKALLNTNPLIIPTYTPSPTLSPTASPSASPTPTFAPSSTPTPTIGVPEDFFQYDDE